MQFKGAFLHNEFRKAEKGSQTSNKNPFDLTQVHYEWKEDLDFVSEAIDASKKAFQKWKRLTIAERLPYFHKLKDEFKKRAPEIENSIILEIGKARWEAKQEAQALSSKIEITLSTMIPILEQIASHGTTKE